jgi:poly-beta-1,6-N-acetyl-D-glucosamine synthase
MDPLNTRYVVISPVRDEESYLTDMIACMIAQTVRPLQWIIVDDGSTDTTGRIIDEHAARYPWITAVHCENRGFRKAGGGVVDAFNAGYAALTPEKWDFIVKLDGDLSFTSDYFEHCFEEFASEPHLGVAGGVICHVIDAKEQVEACPAFHVRGATKIYREKCWNAIGGFWPVQAGTPWTRSRRACLVGPPGVFRNCI